VRAESEIAEVRDALGVMLTMASMAGESFERNAQTQAVKCALDWVLNEGSASADMDALMQKWRAQFRRLQKVKLG